jgi:hypothetical protein
VCLCRSLQVTKVMILSILFSLKEEQDHEREKEVAARVTFVTFFFETQLRTANTENLKRGRVSASLLHSLPKSRHQGNFMPADALYCLVSTIFNGSNVPTPERERGADVLVKKNAFLNKLRGRASDWPMSGIGGKAAAQIVPSIL